ncbi:MAG: hypothetical protein KA059_03140 [Elusimicrobiales bacterium]|nr:hypothetical protein [Elusimicrobiales bacterium]
MQNLKDNFDNFISMPFLLGVIDGINSFNDICLIIDGPNCIMPRLEYIYGNHDIYSTLLSPLQEHRITYTMNDPLSGKDLERRLLFSIEEQLSYNKYSAIFISPLPFQRIARVDYLRIINSIKSDIPIIYVEPRSCDEDWIDGYVAFLESILNYLLKINGNVKNKKNTISVLGLLFDRNEYDNIANVAEIKKILNFLDFNDVYVFPSGTSFKETLKIIESENLIVLPYLYAFSDLVLKKYKANVFNLKLPFGINNSLRWGSVLRKGKNISKLNQLAIDSMSRVLPVLNNLAGKNALYFGEPFMLDSIADFLNELNISIKGAFLNTGFKKGINIQEFKYVFFNPSLNRIKNIIKNIKSEDDISFFIGNCFIKSLDIMGDSAFLEFGFPSYSNHSIYNQPYLGFDGFVNFTDKIFNTIIRS